jgi:hypothetical protein
MLLCDLTYDVCISPDNHCDLMRRFIIADLQMSEPKI